MPELSIIVPFVNEYPQVSFTLRSIIEELDDRVDWEIIAINNYSQKVADQKRPEDKGGEHVQNLARLHGGRLKYIKWDEKLSHWNAKNVGVAASSGKFLCFIDAHCIVGRNALFRPAGGPAIRCRDAHHPAARQRDFVRSAADGLSYQSGKLPRGL